MSIVSARRALEGARVLDLFAGSGALAFEALSRGAASAVCVDRASGCGRVIDENSVTLGLADRCELIQLPVDRALELLHRRGQRFDLVFVDPPYARSPWPTAARLEQLQLLSAAAAVAVEHGAQTRPPAQLGGLALALNRGYGDTALSLFTCDANQADELEG